MATHAMKAQPLIFNHVNCFATVTDSSADVPTASTAPAVEDPNQWFSSASRRKAFAVHKNLKGSPRKVNELCKMIRGLSVQEALIQLSFASNQKQVFVANCLKAASTNGVNNFHMSRDRLYVISAAATKGRYKKQMKPASRGRAHIINNYYCHIRIEVAEQPWNAGEKRIGLAPSRTFEALAKTKDKIAAYKEKVSQESLSQA